MRRNLRARYGLYVALALVAARAAAVFAAEVALNPPGAPGWRALEFPKIARHTTYTVVNVDGLDAVKAQSDCSASALYRSVEQVDVHATPRLQWRWRVDKPLSVPNERDKVGDDFAARVYVMFRFDAEHASLLERLRHKMGTALYGDIVPGNAINYVWSSREPLGARWDNPFTAASKMVSLGHEALGQWIDEIVDVADDYRAFFGQEPPPLLAVAVMTDSDNSCQQATAYYADFRFLSQ